MNVQDALAVSAETGEWGIFSLIFSISFLVTWIIGLAPILIARYAIFKKPVSRRQANWMVGTWCFICVATFIAINADHGEKANSFAWLLVFIVGRWLLIREGKANIPEEGAS